MYYSIAFKYQFPTEDLDTRTWSRAQGSWVLDNKIDKHDKFAEMVANWSSKIWAYESGDSSINNLMRKDIRGAPALQ